MMTKIICTLRPNYRNFILAMDNLDEALKNIHFLTSRLLKEETMNKNSLCGNETADTIIFTRNYPTSSLSLQAFKH